VETLALNGGWHGWATTGKAHAIGFRFAFDLLFLQNENASVTKVKVFPKQK